MHSGSNCHTTPSASPFPGPCLRPASTAQAQQHPRVLPAPAPCPSLPLPHLPFFKLMLPVHWPYALLLLRRCDNSRECYLHLHGASSWDNLLTSVPSVYTNPSAPGVIMSSGNVGPKGVGLDDNDGWVLVFCAGGVVPSGSEGRGCARAWTATTYGCVGAGVVQEALFPPALKGQRARGPVQQGHLGECWRPQQSPAGWNGCVFRCVRSRVVDEWRCYG